jgi:hypothetical protein
MSISNRERGRRDLDNVGARKYNCTLQLGEKIWTEAQEIN